MERAIWVVGLVYLARLRKAIKLELKGNDERLKSLFKLYTCTPTITNCWSGQNWSSQAQDRQEGHPAAYVLKKPGFGGKILG